MKFTVLFSEITDQLKEMSRIAASNKPEDSTQNILMTVAERKLTMRSTDGNIELEAQIPLVDVESDGATTINAGKLYEVCSKSGKASTAVISLDEASQMLQVHADNTVYEIRSPSADTFPSFEDAASGVKLTLTQKQLKQLIDMSGFCVSNDDFREYLRGIRFEGEGTKLNVFASDGHRMVALETTLLEPLAEPLGALLTKNSTIQIANVIDSNSEQPVELQITKNTVSLYCNGYKLKSKLIAIAYPNVRSIIPVKYSGEAVLDVRRFATLIARVSVMSSKRVNGITLNFGNGTYSLRASNSERESAVATEPLPEYTGPNIEVSFNYTYVNETLSHLNAEKVMIKFPDPLNGANFIPVADGEAKPNNISAQFIISKIVL